MSGENLCSVLVTGANRGIGLELVKQFLGQPKPPQKVFATCWDLKGGGAQELKMLASKHPNLVILQLDLNVEDSVRGILRVLSRLSEEQNGRVVDWEGRIVPW